MSSHHLRIDGAIVHFKAYSLLSILAYFAQFPNSRNSHQFLHLLTSVPKDHLCGEDFLAVPSNMALPCLLPLFLQIACIYVIRNMVVGWWWPHISLQWACGTDWKVSPRSHLLVFTPVCKSLLLSIGRTCDMFLTNRIWQRQWDAITVYVISWLYQDGRLHLASTLALSIASTEEASCHEVGQCPVGEVHLARVYGQDRGPEQETEGLGLTALGRWIRQTTLVSLEVDPLAVEPPDENRALANVFFSLVEDAANSCPDAWTTETVS